ncbi:MAG: Wzz/FepE/Etk N-terminal domain-containing protein, partial [Maribacter sp.]
METGIKEIISSYTKHWKWFLLSVVLALTIAFFFLRYATPEYAAMAKIEILEDTNSRSELSAFSDIGPIVGTMNAVTDQIQILNSTSNFIKVVKDLDLNQKITSLGSIKDSEIYLKKPIKLNFIANDSIIDNAAFEFYLELTSNSSFGLSLESDSPTKIYSYGENISTPMGDIVITPNMPHFEEYRNKKLRINITPVYTLALMYQLKIAIDSGVEGSNIITLALNDPIQEKAKDIINRLIGIYNENAILDKKEIADRTSEFINERIRDISSDLTSADQTAEDFKTTRGLNDIASEANLALNVGAANRQELENAKLQLNIASGVKEFVSNEKGYEILPTNIGLNDASITNTAAKYNELVAERNRLLQSADEKNPIIVNLDQQLNSLKSSMTSSLEGVERNLGMQVNNLSGQLSRMNSIRYSAPKNQRQLTDITRQQQTTESLYLYLLQKREEAQITAASSPAQSK